MGIPASFSRRRALGLGAGVIGAIILAPGSLANATVTGATETCDGGASGSTPYYWHGPDDPYNEPNLGGIAQPTPNLILNPSFEDGALGSTAPSWTFVPPPPPP
jgi:hypothetical protein